MIIKNLLLEVITFFNILLLVKSNIEYKINENITENNDIKNSYNFNQDFSEFNNSLKSILERDIILENELMKKHTTFRIGGPAKYFVKPKTVNQIIEIIKLCNKYKVSYFILGNGSNLLVSDSGYNGVVIQINESNFSNLKVRKKTKENYILKVGGGMSMRTLSIEAGLLSLKGLEDIIDIPGTVGGGIVMNATFRGNGLSNSLESVKVITSEGTLMRLTKKECGLTTRSSVLKDKKYLVIEATFKLEKGNQMEIQKTMTHNTELRYQKQPMYYGSAGSFFVWNHTKHGSMYEKYKKNNLVSYRVGDAMIYTNNISFIINLRNASAADVINVVRHIEKVIKDNYNIDMRREVVVFGWIGINSILNQTFKDFELICIDDGSIENSMEILEKFKVTYNRIKVIHFEQNKGADAARNTRIENTKGEFIGFVDNDDYIDKRFYENLLQK